MRASAASCELRRAAGPRVLGPAIVVAQLYGSAYMRAAGLLGRLGDLRAELACMASRRRAASVSVSAPATADASWLASCASEVARSNGSVEQRASFAAVWRSALTLRPALADRVRIRRTADVDQLGLDLRDARLALRGELTSARRPRAFCHSARCCARRAEVLERRLRELRAAILDPRPRRRARRTAAMPTGAALERPVHRAARLELDRDVDRVVLAVRELDR